MMLSIFFFFFAVRGRLTVVASPVAEHRLRMRRLSGHGSRAQPLRGMWDPPRPGHEPMSPASAGGLSTAGPPGKPSLCLLVGAFNPFTCKVIIDMYVPITIFLIV